MADHASSKSQADTRIFYIVHKTFRLATNRFVDATERLIPSTLQPIIGPKWAFYDAVLHHHHHTEDDNIYPALLAVRPDLNALIEDLAKDHRELTGTMGAVNDAVSAFQKSPDLAQQETLHKTIVAVRDAFFPHLDVEDAEIIPAIKQSMPPKEWDRLDKQALKTIPRQYLPLAVGALDEVIQSVPTQDRPPGPPPPIRLMLTLSWRKKWTSWVQPLLA